MSAFDYCPLIWMFCRKQGNTLLNTTHRRALSAVLGQYTLSFDELLQNTKSIPIHTRNLRLLLVEIFKTLNNLNPKIMWDTFTIKPSRYPLRSGQNLILPPSKSTLGNNSFDFRAALAWNYLPSSLKSATNILEFKEKLKKITIYCNCKICS